MMKWKRSAAGLLALLVVSFVAHAATRPHKEALEWAGLKRTYYLFVPESVSPSAAAPLLVLLHGSGQNGLALLRQWTELATAEGFILVAPNALDSNHWQIKKDGPAFVRDVIDAVTSSHAIDWRRVYLFGLSGGAVYALTLAMLESDYFAATVIYTGAWREEKNYTVVPFAKRKIPVAIFVGDRDEFFPLKSVRDTERALQEAGHPIMVTILKRQGHSYRDVVPRVNREAWDFMHAIELSGDPKFQSYDQS